MQELPSSRLVDVAEDSDRLLADAHRSSKAGLEDGVHHVLRDAFYLTDLGISGIFEDDVYTAELIDLLGEPIFDLLQARNVDPQCEKFVRAVLGGQIGQDLGLSQSGYR